MSSVKLSQNGLIVALVVIGISCGITFVVIFLIAFFKLIGFMQNSIVKRGHADLLYF